MPGALSSRDTATVYRAIEEARAAGRIVEAVEVHPTRRIAAGAWTLAGVRLISNGLNPVGLFTLKVRGDVFEYDDLDFSFE